ncbi:hypothetical protein V6O07_11960, partial [Arthrospira platensis SPKY2]
MPQEGRLRSQEWVLGQLTGWIGRVTQSQVTLTGCPVHLGLDLAQQSLKLRRCGTGGDGLELGRFLRK